MKMTLKYTQFVFVDDKSNEYDVVCPDAKRGENKFKVYKNGIYLNTYTPRGGHVNKTQAKQFLLSVLSNYKP